MGISDQTTADLTLYAEPDGSISVDTGARFVAVGAGVTFESKNGTEWTSKPNENAPPATAFGNGCFVGCDWRGRLMRSEDGVRWEQTFKAPHHIEALGYGGNGMTFATIAARMLLEQWQGKALKDHELFAFNRAR